jgi:SAM-dependent methyltransferase
VSLRPSTNARTLAAYEAAAEDYERAEPARNPPALTAFLEAFSQLLPAGTAVLEFGSATGRDAAFLEERGLCVHRTDATWAFVQRLRSKGLAAEPLNVLSDELGGPWRAMYAGAVFLHLSEAELGQVLAKTASAALPGGLLAFTLKEGDGSRWTTAKLDRPRHFTYWREPGLRSLIEASPWEVIAVEHAAGHTEPWLHCLCVLRCAPFVRRVVP